MNDEVTAGAETPAAETLDVAATVETSEATTEQPSEAVTSETGDDAAAEKPKRKHWAHDRIDELTRQRREAERQADYWKARATQTVDIESLNYEDQIAERTIQRTRQEQAETAKASAEQLAAEAFGYREAIARERFTDYDVVTRNPTLRITPAMAQVIHDSEAGPDLAYHLGKNPAEAAQIAGLPTHLQAAALGRLEALVTAPKAAPKLPAAPVRPISGMASGGDKDPSSMSMAEYIAWRKAG